MTLLNAQNRRAMLTSLIVVAVAAATVVAPSRAAARDREQTVQQRDFSTLAKKKKKQKQKKYEYVYNVIVKPRSFTGKANTEPGDEEYEIRYSARVGTTTLLSKREQFKDAKPGTTYSLKGEGKLNGVKDPDATITLSADCLELDNDPNPDDDLGGDSKSLQVVTEATQGLKRISLGNKNFTIVFEYEVTVEKREVK